MRFLQLAVENFGVFRGRHEFDLAPRFSDAPENVVVFSGHNGAGKTSLFTAIQIALHGSLAIGDRVTRDDYSDFVFHRLHRYFADGETVVSASGGVELTFEYTRSGQIMRVDVARRWARRAMRIDEHATVRVDGTPVDGDMQAWMNDLLGPSLLPLMFFDAEQLALLSDAREYEKLLQRNLTRLLGLDLADRLDNDLGHYLAREDSTARAAVIETELQHIRAQVATLTAALDAARARNEDATETVARLRGDLLAAERQLAAEGGAFAHRRTENVAAATRLQSDIAALEKRLAEAAGELLPFALTAPLVRQLSARLATEATDRDRFVAAREVRRWAAALRDSLTTAAFWARVKATSRVRTAVIAHVDAQIGRIAEDGTPGHFLHNVSDAERAKIDAWISEILTSIPSVAADQGRQLDALHAELQRVQGEIASAPPEGALQPIAERIAALQSEITVAERAHATILAEIGALEFRLSEQQRFCDKLLHESDSLRREDNRVELARRSRLAIRTFAATMQRAAVAEFASMLVEYFNLLCRKDELLARVSIDPETFRIQFEAAAGHVLRLPNFSAGERQLVALAAFWAFRTVARRPLPLAIDTPLGRLDEVHRAAVLTDYLPIVADQVLLFATDAELTVAETGEFRYLVARVYRLRFDMTEQQTLVVREERPPLNAAIRHLDEITAAEG